MLLYVVRHAESLANVSRSAVVDCDLSDLGRAQAAALAGEIKRLGVDRVLSSPYRRALCTAQEIAQLASAPLGVLSDLHEHHMGVLPADWPLMTRSEIVVNFPAASLPDEMPDRGYVAAPETDALVLERMGRVLRQIEAQSGRIAVVTHGSPAGKLVQAFLGIADSSRVEVAIDNAAITILESNGYRRYVRLVNGKEHLRDVMAPPPVVEAVATSYL